MWEIIGIGLLTIAASGVGTLTGFGTSTIMVPVLLLMVPLPQTLLLVGVIHWFGDVWKLTLFRQGIRWKLIFAFGIPGVLATFIGARIVLAVPDTSLLRVLGAFLIGYVLFLFFKPSFSFRQTTGTAAVGGALSGFFAGIFGVGGAVRSAFLTAFNLPKAVYLATAGAIALVIDSTRIATYISGSVRFEAFLLWGFLLFIPASFLGAYLAKRVVGRIPQKQFRIVVGIFLLFVGVKLVFFPG